MPGLVIAANGPSDYCDCTLGVSCSTNRNTSRSTRIRFRTKHERKYLWDEDKPSHKTPLCVHDPCIFKPKC